MNRIVKALIISLVISGFLVSGGFLLVKKIRENNDLHSLLKNNPATSMYTAQGTLRLAGDHSDHPSPALGPLQKRIGPLCAHLTLERTNDGAYTLTADGIKDSTSLKTLLTARSSIQWWPLYSLLDFSPILVRADSLLGLSLEKKGKMHSDSDTGTDTATATTVEQLLAKKEKGHLVIGNDEGLKHPIFSLLHVSALSGQNKMGDYSEIGYISTADTAALNLYMEASPVKACMPADVAFMYGNPYSAEDEPVRFLALYAVKRNEPRPMLDESFLVDVSLGTEQRYGQQVMLHFNQLGASRLERLTMANIDHYIAMIVNDEVLIAPRVEDAVSDGNLAFTGNERYARLVYLLAKYPLPAPVVIDRLAFSVQPSPSPFKPVWLLIGLAVFSLVFLLTLSIDKAFKNMAKGKRQ